MSTRVTVIIKAINEERHIRRAVESALHALRGLDGRVILADSGSTDATLRIACGFGIDIVQLARQSERCCGVGAQLGYQFADGEYVYILDGDMELIPGFLEAGIELLESDPRLAGVAGLVEELGGGNYEFEVRKSIGDGRVLGAQTSLDMGGLYKTKVIDSIGYLTNRNLHSYEEKELGWRLIAAGYRVERIATPAVRHFGKSEDTLDLIKKRWRSHYYDGPGEWIRAAVASGHALHVAVKFKQMWIVALSWVALLGGLIALLWTPWPLLLVSLLNLAIVAHLFLKRRSLYMAWMGYIHLHVLTAGMVRGLLMRQRPPADCIEAVIVQSRNRAPASYGAEACWSPALQHGDATLCGDSRPTVLP